MTRMNVSLNESLVEELRRVVPTRQRSQFISVAVEEKLDQLKQEQAVQAAAGIWSSEGRDDPDEEIRALRRGWNRLLRSQHDGLVQRMVRRGIPRALRPPRRR